MTFLVIKKLSTENIVFFVKNGQTSFEKNYLVETFNYDSKNIFENCVKESRSCLLHL